VYASTPRAACCSAKPAGASSAVARFGAVRWSLRACFVDASNGVDSASSGGDREVDWKTRRGRLVAS